jgi:PTS system mannose-specific IIA component
VVRKIKGSKKMLKIIVVSHGNYARELVNSAQMIIGELKNVQSFGLHPGDDVDSLRQDVFDAIANAKKESDVLVLTDMVSGSPFNVTASAMENLDFYHFAGINLPTFLEICSSREYLETDEICKSIVEQGKSTIVDVNELMGEATE